MSTEPNIRAQFCNKMLLALRCLLWLSNSFVYNELVAIRSMNQTHYIITLPIEFFLQMHAYKLIRAAKVFLFARSYTVLAALQCCSIIYAIAK